MELFIDTETVAKYALLANAPSDYRAQWFKYWRNRNKEVSESEAMDACIEAYPREAPLVPEFSQVCTIALGYFKGDGTPKVGAKTSKDETELLGWFSDIANRGDYWLVAHNGRTFDFPFLTKRMLIQQTIIPKQLQTLGIKPWDMRWRDTMDIWGCGDRYNRISLDLLCFALGIESPKKSGDGAKVSELFWSDQFKRLNEYCKGGVIALMRVWKRLEALKYIPNN